MPIPFPSIQFRTKLQTVKPPARFAVWMQQYGKRRMRAYCELRRRAVQYWNDDPDDGRPITQRELVTRVLHCHPNIRMAMLSELVSIGLIGMEMEGEGMIIYVKSVPKTPPPSPLVRNRGDAKPGDLIAEFVKRCREYTGERPYIVRGKDYKIASRLLEQYSLKTLSPLIQNYFEDVSKGIYNKGFNLAHFSSQISTLIGKRGPLGTPGVDSRLVKDAQWHEEGRREILDNPYKDRKTKRRELAALDGEYAEHRAKNRKTKRTGV